MGFVDLSQVLLHDPKNHSEFSDVCIECGVSVIDVRAPHGGGETIATLSVLLLDHGERLIIDTNKIDAVLVPTDTSRISRLLVGGVYLRVSGTKQSWTSMLTAIREWPLHRIPVHHPINRIARPY